MPSGQQRNSSCRAMLTSAVISDHWGFALMVTMISSPPSECALPSASAQCQLLMLLIRKAHHPEKHLLSPHVSSIKKNKKIPLVISNTKACVKKRSVCRCPKEFASPGLTGLLITHNKSSEYLSLEER